MQLDAPIVAVTVHPRHARVTRRGRVELPAGPTELVLAGLPAGVEDDSVRVTGWAEGSAGAVRVSGVDVVRRDLARTPDPRVAAAEAAVRAAAAALAEVDDADAADAARAALLDRLANRAGDRLAVAMAEGSAGVARVVEVGAAVADQLRAVAADRRGHAARREQVQQELAAAQAELDRRHVGGRERRDVVVTCEVGFGEGGTGAGGGVPAELEVGYLVGGATWSTAYDARLLGPDRLSLTWYGMVTQHTGEDWPACALTLSTARPAAAAGIPELDPWWIDQVEHAVPVAMAAAAPVPSGPRRSGAKALADRAEVTPETAEVMEGRLAASWRLPRPTAVPADGTPHRAVVSVFDLPARLDHVAVPVLAPEAQLRATATNTSGQVLLAGPVSAFLDDAFSGATTLARTAPDAEIELALGVDDRVVVERERVRRTARTGAARGAAEHWRTTVTNHRDDGATVVVRDRVPVSRSPEVEVVDVAFDPAPTERDELGRVSWTVPLDAGATWTLALHFGVEHPKDVAVTGWR